MNTKLTLSIDDQIITKAKRYAKNSGRSLSGMIENYLKSITSSEKDEMIISPKVKALMGTFKVPGDFDYKKELAEILSEKYTR